MKLAFCLLALCLAATTHAAEPTAARTCRIEVVEQGSGWPVPLVDKYVICRRVSRGLFEYNCKNKYS